jgi:hypothetical protein
MPGVTQRDDINMSLCKVAVEDHKSQSGRERRGESLVWRSATERLLGWIGDGGRGWDGGRVQCNSCRICNFPMVRSSQGPTESIYLNVLLNKHFLTMVF